MVSTIWGPGERGGGRGRTELKGEQRNTEKGRGAQLVVRA